jgi:c-di-GMP-binding flagellar brake protein YcgR
MVEKHFGMRLDIELGTRIMLDIDGMEGKMKSMVVGQEPSEFLIVKAPVGHAGVRRNLFEGNKVTVRYAHHGHVYGFDSFILAVVNKPRSLLFLDYPTKIAQASLRKNERFDCYIPCKAAFNDNEEQGTIVDASLCGCRCLLPSLSRHSERKPPRIDQEIVLSFESPADETQMEIAARVINTTEYHSAARVGMAFNEGTDELEERIKNLTGFLSIQ